MKRLLVILVCSAAPITAHAETLGYLEGSVGAAFIQDLKTKPLTITVGPNTASGRLIGSFKTNLTGGVEFGAAGLAHGNIRIGASYDYIRAKLESITATGTVNGVPGSITIPGSTLQALGADIVSSAHVAAVQFYYNAPALGAKLRAYVGAGVGAAFIPDFGPELAFSATAGARYELTPKTYVGFRYRYHHVSGISDDFGINYDAIGAHTVSALVGVYLN